MVLLMVMQIKPEFISTVNSFNNALLTTNATLTFPAISDLDETVVECRGVQTIITRNCTLLIKSKYSSLCIIIIVSTTI